MDNFSLFFLISGLNNQYPALDYIMIFGAEYLIYFAFILMFVLAVWGGSNEKKALLLTLFCLPILVIIIKVIHLFFFEPRPFISFDISPLIPYKADASFPSRHASIISSLAFAYTYLKSKWAPFFLIIMIWVGLSRIYVGVHYPLDIIGGFLVGIFSLIVALQIKNLLKFNLKSL